MSDRPAIPREVDRAVRVEAGHRCAIPTCRQTSGLQIHHIVPWAQVQRHTFDNLILICAICHSRVDVDIDRKAMQIYKANLGVINGRYGDLERRVLEWFLADESRKEVVLDRAQDFMMSYLFEDGMVDRAGPADGALQFRTENEFGEEPINFGPERWVLTEAGKGLVDRLRSARQVD